MKPRTFVPRALLYNDGGFDVDVSGNVLCVCAELFLPDGVNNAMELLHKEQWMCEEPSHDEGSVEKNESLLHVIAPDESDAPLTDTVSNTAAQSAVIDSPVILNNAVNNFSTRGCSVSFREGMDDNVTGSRVPRTPNNTSPERHAVQHAQDALVPITGFIPMTPPVSTEPRFRNLSPPPPPGSRFMGRGILRTRDVGSYGHGHSQYSTTHGTVPYRSGSNRGLTTPPPTARMGMRPPHPLSLISSSSSYSSSPRNDNFVMKGRYVPHVVTVSLDTSPIPEEIRDASIAHGKPPGAVARGYRPRLGQLLEACPLDASKASAVTCVKFSPSADFCLIGYGVRDPLAGGGSNFHPVTAVFRVRGGMDHVSTMLSGDDDVNIARFHPDSGHSFVYGTKQGRVRVLSPRPWNFYGDF
jgi:activator-of-BECN1-regulated-autophagy protein 1